MAARVAIGADARERLRRLSVVFAVELRLKIVAELYMRPMSAKQFHEEFGGGSPARVNQNFKMLAREDWLRYLRSEGPGGSRRGGVEHFYRATEPAFFDRETWGLLPYSVRVTSSWNIFRQVAPRLRGALELSRMKADDTHDLTCTQLLLDERGWRRVMEAVTAHFVHVYDEQEDSHHRARHSGEELRRTDVFLVGFESPTTERELPTSVLLESRLDPNVSFPERLAPILGDEISMQILAELNRRQMSVTQFHREFGMASKSAISRRFKGLEGGGWVGKTGEKQRRGATERFYRATKPAILDYDPCIDPPGVLLATESWCAFERLSEKMREAMMAGSFDARRDRCVSWSFVSLDRQGRSSVIKGTEDLLGFISQEQARAQRRMAKSGEEPIAMTVGLAVLEGSRELAKAP
ncbi:MAG TPA: winged helix-turn-helix domain-containing protein [Solirubrobacterales bacterium]